MILPLIYFLPSLVSLIWLVSFSFQMRMRRQTQYMISLFFSAVFYAIYAIYFYPTVDYDIMALLEPICLPAGLFCPIFMLSCLHIHRTGQPFSHRTMYAFLVPPIIVSTVVILLYYLVGVNDAACINRAFASGKGFCDLPPHFDTSLTHTFCFCTYDLFVLYGSVLFVLLIREIFLIVRQDGYRLGDVFRFFFLRKATTNSRAFAFLILVEVMLMLPAMVVGSTTIVEHPVLGCALLLLLSVVKFCASHLEFYYAQMNTRLTLYELSHVKVGVEDLVPSSQPVEEEPLVTEHAEIKEEQETLAVPEPSAEEQVDVVVPSESPCRLREAAIIERFVYLMEEEKIFKRDDLTAETLCNFLGVKRTTLSTVLNGHFNKPLRDIINHYRIEEAKRFMLAHPTATQEEVAAHCGFRNAQYLNTKFKIIVGRTPAMWLAERSLNG